MIGLKPRRGARSPAGVRRAAGPLGSESGATLVEYALTTALVAVVCIISLQFLGQNANAAFSGAGQAMQEQQGGDAGGLAGRPGGGNGSPVLGTP